MITHACLAGGLSAPTFYIALLLNAHYSMLTVIVFVYSLCLFMTILVIAVLTMI